MTHRAILFAVVLVSTAAHAQIQTCPGSGLTVSGGRLGDAFSLAIDGPPGAAAVLASDVLPGPVLTPFGTICLGLSPSVVMSVAPLDATGHFGLSGVLPLASIFPAGSTQYLQAAIAHPSLPGGFQLTNGAAVTIRPPRMAGFGIVLPPTGGTLWSYGMHQVDPVTDTLAANLSIPWVTGPIVHLNSQGWFGAGVQQHPNYGVAILPPNHSFICIDDQTGATVLTIPDVWSMQGGDFGVSPDGTLMTVVLTGQAPAYDRFWVKTYSLVSGALLSLQAVSSPGYLPRGIYHVPGTSLVYIASTDKFHVYDGGAGAEIATILLPGNLAGNASSYFSGIRYAFPHQNMLHCVVGASLVTIDMTVHAIVNQVPLPFSQTVPHAIGPGSLGPALWATAPAMGSSSSQLVEIPLSTLTPINVTPLQIAPLVAKPSAGGTEMLFEFGWPVNGLMAVNAATHAVVNLPGLIGLSVLRSDTLTKAYALGLGGPSTSLLSIPTDPCTGATTPVMGAPNPWLISN